LLRRFDPSGGAEEEWDLGERIGTVVPRESGGLVLAGDSGFRTFDPQGGGSRALGDPEADKPDNRFNDGKCSPDGRFFAGTISLVKKTGDARLYRLDPDLTIHEVFGPVTNSNGIVWSADGRTVWYIDTPRREVLAFDYEDGHLAKIRSAFSTTGIDGSPDGMAIDERGMLWIAFCHAASVVCFDPERGVEERRVEFPCMETTACAFGGAELADLYVTTGVHATVEQELAGRLFVVKGLGVKGVTASAFGG
jgi:sugar lactone lactonase YvrE